MRAWEVARPGPIEQEPLRFVERPVPVPRSDELLVHVRACGVCRTDLHVSEGDLPVRRPHVTPGHEVVGGGGRAGGRRGPWGERGGPHGGAGPTPRES
ncbi:alcohol dehydrogenase catalytic domain-containing protein, partial [Streptomyces sp. NPDC059466]|uniref:alcohol dehydrogenase catalytic domain-containing protein n=1 Tax=Streptomyces sp. NPDC059466 TaxID=3346843 RepID=UPI0036BE0DD6